MRARVGIVGMLWLIGAGAVLLSLIVFAALLGPSRAASIAMAAAANVVADGLAERTDAHRIPVLDLRVDAADLDSLNEDLPWSGGKNVSAVLAHNGVEYKAKFRYRGIYTPSHFLGDKKSFRLSLKARNPWAPYRKVNVINPKAFNLVNDHLSAWVAGSMGVAVPLNEMVFVRLNGKAMGVMELFEQLDGEFERARHLSDHQVPVYKGDYPSVEGKQLPKGRTLWQSAAHWEYVSKADSTEAHAKLVALVSALAKDDAPVEAHRDSIARLVDVDAFLRYEAALLVINSLHVDQYHNQWLVLDPRTQRFYPVLWDALLMFAPADAPLYRVHDAMAWWVLRVPEWRLQRDRYAYQALLALQRQGGFDRQLDATVDRIAPSVLADRNKFGNVTLFPEDVHRYSVLHVIGSLAGLRSSVHSYWERTLQRMEVCTVKVDRGAQWRIRTASEAPLCLHWQGGDGVLTVNGTEHRAESVEGEWRLLLHRDLKPPAGGKDHPLADRQVLVVEPLDIVVAFANGIPPSLRITNAITNEAIQ